MKGIMSICGFVAAACGMVIDAITKAFSGDDGHDPIPTNTTNVTQFSLFENVQEISTVVDAGEGGSLIRRALEDVTTSEFTPSIIFMSIAIFIFFPRVVSHILISLTNLRYSIAVNRTLKILFVMFFLALPMSLFLCQWGGASPWTFVTIPLMFLHVSYALMTMAIKKIDSDLIDVSFLSCDEWREFNMVRDGCYLHGILKTLIDQRQLVREAMKRLAHQSCLLIPALLLWPHLFKALIRIQSAEEIRQVHSLDPVSLQRTIQNNNWTVDDHVPKTLDSSLITTPVAIAVPLNDSDVIFPKDRI